MSQIERHPITSREQWMRLRQCDVTASTAGALVGVHPYQSNYGLYLLKSGLVAEDPEETPPMKRGRLLEPTAVQLLREERPNWKIDTYPVGFYYRDPSARMGATPDVLATDENGRRLTIQIKTVEPSIFRRQWKNEDGVVEPPLWIVVQGIIEAHLTNSEAAYVAPLVVGFGLEMPVIEIPIHGGIVDRIKGEIAKLWKRVEDKSPPDPDYSRDGALIARLYPKDDGTTIDLSESNSFVDLIDRHEKLKAEEKKAKEECGEVDAEIKAMVGDHTFAIAADGRMISLKLVSKKEHMVKASSYRQMRVIASKAAKVA